MDTNDENCVVYNVGPETELRFLVTELRSVSLKLLDGFGEIFGTELNKGEMYTFLPPASISLFTWQGCSVKFYGKPKKMFIEKQPLEIIPTYMHACLEERRMKAELENTRGPISLVIGARDVGKTSFCRILLNYAARQGRRPLYVDLDVDQNSASLPGAISILPVEKPCDVTQGFNHRALSAYAFGYANPSSNLPLYLLIIKELGKKIKTELKNGNRSTLISGVIIDTYGWVGGDGYTTNKLIASAFNVDVIFVINDRDLCLNLRKEMPSAVEVVLIPKQAGAVVRRKSIRSRCQDTCIGDYFFGLNNQLNAHKFEVKFSEIEIYKILPISRNCVLRDVGYGDISIVKVPLGVDLVYHILSLSYSDTANEMLVKTNVVGFVCVTNVCLKNDAITLLSPQPYPLPSKILIMGNIKLR